MKQSLQSIFRTIIILVLISNFTLISECLGSEKTEKIESLMKSYEQIGRFNGTVLVAESGEVIYKNAFGNANFEWDIPNTVDTKFRLASITKQFTSMAIMQLVDAGKIMLDGKLSDYLSYYRKDTGKKVTIRQLLTHTSGIPSYTGNPQFGSEVMRNPFTIKQLVQKYCSDDLDFEPGTDYRYNNSGYLILGGIIEEVSGKSYEDYLQQNIFNPLGMKNSGYDHNQEILKKRAYGYTRSMGIISNANYIDMTVPYSAGALYSTVEDLYKWDRGLHENKLIPRKLKKEMFTPFLSNYAFGWAVGKMPVGETGDSLNTVSHSGGINGFSTRIIRFPKEEHLIVLLSNFENISLNQIAQNLLNIIYDQPVEELKIPISEAVYEKIQSEGLENAIAFYRESKEKNPEKYDFGEAHLNLLGYHLLQNNRVDEAIAIFKLNVEMFPESFNVYDSLGEALFAKGETESAIKNYAKSLELNPKNRNAVNMMHKIMELDQK